MTSLVGVATFAGCLSDGAANADAPGVPDGAAAVAPMAVENNITISMSFTTPGIFSASPAGFAPGGGLDPPSCAPTAPQTCWVGVHETMFPGDTAVLNGTFVDTAHAGTGLTERLGFWVFTGSVAGCTGSGSFTMPWTGAPDEEPLSVNTNGEIFHAHDFLGAPTSFDGFANISGGWIDAEYDINPVTFAISNGTLTGYLTCE